MKMPLIKDWLANKYVKIALLSLITVSVVGGAVVLVSNFDASPVISDHGSNGNQSGSNEGIKGNEASTPKRKAYPIGKWDTAIPYINPFGSQENYNSIKYIPNESQELRYINKDNIETFRATSGEVWQMQVEWKDKTVDPFDDLSLYISELGGEFYLADREGRVIHAKDNENNDWWGVSVKSGNGYLLTVYKELKLESGKTVTFKTEDFKKSRIYFMTENTNHKYQSIKATLADGVVGVMGRGSFIQGQYRRDIYYVKTMSAFKTKNYAFNDIPQDTTTPILWEISWDTDRDPEEISFTLDEGDDISAIRDGERLGALKVRGDTLGQVKVEMAPGIKMNHPELDMKGDKTPEGDTLFWLPSGHWNVVFESDQYKTDASTLTTRLVPVSSGEMTVLDIQPLVNHSYIKKEVGNSSGGESQLKVLNAIEEGEQAKISFMLLDSQDPKFAPTPSNMEILEGGQSGKIIKVERIKTPASVVLVLDSSGSMKGSMEKVLESARTFIRGLPDNTHIQVIDFDTESRLLEGTNKEQVLKGLSRIKANGATALYDSVIQGIELLRGSQRPTLVVFTDGVDSNANDTGPGSKATKQQVEKTVQDSGIPLFTIGFGLGHDNTTLLELAGMSEGTYYSAQDETALNHVFTSINGRLGNNFEVTYERPKEQAPSDVPVISLALDISGSMDVDPSTGLGDYRIDKVKNMYHEFIKQIPGDSLVQLVSFSSEVNVDQVITHRKPELQQALGALRVGRGTNILQSAKLTYQSLKQVPSDKRVIVYLTDAALDVNKEHKEAFEKILTGIKDDGIQVLWVGLGTEDSKDAFKWAAEKSGGKYVISEDPDVLAKALNEALANVQQKSAEKVSLSLTIKNDSKGKNVRQYLYNQLVDFPALQNSNNKVKLNTITYQTGIKVAQYESEAASLLYGSDIPGEDVRIYKRIPLNVKGKNKAMEWTAREIYFMKRLNGVDAPSSKSYMAVDMDMKNIHPEGAPYLIPDFASHFFVTMNHSGSYPASTATWLAETPLAPPGETSVFTKPDETNRGVLIFLVPDENTEQASINFYDTSNGHITLPLIGTPQKEEVQITSLPKSLTGKLSDTFSMTMKASSNLNKIEGVELEAKTSFFKVIEADLNSKVQAQLKMNPQERFYLRVRTATGPFMVPVNTTTAFLPYGLLRPVTMGPGSSNKVRFAFQIPNVLKEMPMELYTDLRGGATVLPVNDAATSTVAQKGPQFQGNGMAMTVNSLARVKSIETYGNYVVLDVTITDTPDESGLYGFRDAFKLVPDGAPSPEEPQELKAHPITDELLLGIHDNWAVFNGTSRRGLLVFNIPQKMANRSWTLQSSQFSTLKLPVTGEAYKEQGLLVKQVSPKVDEKFDRQLAKALMEANSRQKALLAVNPPANVTKKDYLNVGGNEKESVPAPVLTVQGLVQLQSVKTMADFQSLMKGLKWLPSSDDYWRYRNSPESVLTQGWGSEGDLANLTGGLLAKLGYSPSLRMVSVTDKGSMALKKLGNVDEAKQQNLPAWAYSDEQGNAKIFVVPFMKDLSELSGLVYLPGGQEGRSMTSIESKISVYFKVEPIGNTNRNAITGDIAGSLAGGGGSNRPAVQEIRMLDTSLSLDQLGKGAMDIRVAGANGLYTAVLENQTIQIQGNQGIDPSKQKAVGVRIEVQLPQKKLVHETRLKEGEEITGVFHTLAVNLPDLSSEAAETLQKTADREYQAASKPDDHSTLVWYTRNILYRFIANQTKYENQLAKELDVTAGRTDKERVLVVTVRRKDAQSPLRTSINLVQSANELHRGKEEAAYAFNIMSGLFASRLEGAVLPGEKADFMDVWTRSPEGTQLLLSHKQNRKKDLKYMEEQGFPNFLIQRAKVSSMVMLIPNKPTRIYGEDRWAWLEIDPITYETISVWDSGEHGGFAEYLISLEPIAPTGEDYLGFIAGSFIGASTSVWSVSGFSLVLGDYEEILKASKAYTRAIGEALDKMMSNKDLAKLEYSFIGPTKLKLQDADFNYLAKYFEEVKSGKELKLGGDLVGFTLGFNSGAAYYFKQAEKFK